MKKFQLFIMAICMALPIVHAQTLVPNDHMALLKGKVTNFAGKILANEIILFVNENNQKTYRAITDPKGHFEILIPVNANYALKYKNFTSEMDYTKMQVPAEKGATYNVTVKIDPPREFILKDVFFDTGKSSIKSASFNTLNDLAEVLKIKNNMLIEIQGHTDNVGDEAANQKLSEARAAAVKSYLVNKGIKADAIQVKGYGSQMPVADNHTEEGRSKNRRTSLKVLKD